MHNDDDDDDDDNDDDDDIYQSRDVSLRFDSCHRKFMHEIISSVKAADRAVILTTHSMEEADALCSRIGIMAKGQMRCLGTSVHLKQKHGKGFIIAMQTNPSDSDAAISFVRGAFPGAELTHNNAGHMSFNALQTDVKLSSAYSKIEARRVDLGILQYSVLQPTLEQVSVAAATAAAPASPVAPIISTPKVILSLVSQVFLSVSAQAAAAAGDVPSGTLSVQAIGDAAAV